MNLAVMLCSVILLVSGITCSYALWSYYECPKTRSHKPYVFPIFVSVGWFVMAIQGIIADVTNTLGTPNKITYLLLTLATLIALLIFIHYYRRGRKDQRLQEE